MAFEGKCVKVTVSVVGWMSIGLLVVRITKE